jgi:NAD(P)-dependent dehydrogenase (short-subunit alcohol dehydrogenase family)
VKHAACGQGCHRHRRGLRHGASIAQTYAREGAKVAVLDVEEKAGRAVAAEIGENAIFLRCDVARRADIDAAVAATLKAFGSLDILVNNAGVSHVNKPVLEISEAEFDRVFAINVKGLFLFSQGVVPAMRKNGGGVIVNIGSTAGLRPRPGLSAYNATKGAVHNLTKTLAVELAPDNIRVCAIAPVATGHAAPRHLPRQCRRPAREIHCHGAARPAGAAAGHRRHGAVSGFSGREIHHRQYRRGRLAGGVFDPSPQGRTGIQLCMPHFRMVAFSRVRKITLSTNRPIRITVRGPRTPTRFRAGSCSRR